MKQKENRVLVVVPGEYPREVMLKNDLDSLQKAVSIGCECQGVIEVVVRYALPMANVMVFLVCGVMCVDFPKQLR